MYEAWNPTSLLSSLAPDRVGAETMDRLVADASGFGIGCSDLGIEAKMLLDLAFK